MPAQPFHHGNLRVELLERAEAVLRERGGGALSLRELAREAGVSHGAPRSHFIDRQALLDALAVRGFERLTERLRGALEGPGGTEGRFRRVARTYVGFAVDDAALMELMFARKTDESDAAVGEAAARLFQVLDESLDEGPAGDGDGGPDRERFKMLFAATMQGTAALITSRRISAAQGDRILDDAATTMLTSELGRAVLPRR